MAPDLKIAVIGGGSSYTPEIVEGFIRRHAELPVRELWLVDVPAGREKLEIVGALAQRMVAKAGVPIEVHLTLDRRAALAGADFVTTQFRVGGLAARIRDERIPLRYGVIGQETTGPGGFAKALRTVPVILDICRDIEELCPDAWLINFTNPTGILSDAILQQFPGLNMIGLCNVPINMHMITARLLGSDVEHVQVDFAGLNHLVYGLAIRLDGRDVTRQFLGDLADGNFSLTMRNIADLGWAPDFIRSLGMLPCPYHRYYYQTDEMYAQEVEAAAGPGTRGEQVQRLEAELFELYKHPDLAAKPPQLEKRGGAYYSEAACNLMASVYNNKCDIQPVNTRNNGAIADLPPDVAVEVSSVITSRGPRPLAVGHLPLPARGLVQLMKSYELLTVQAAVHGDYDAALQALTLNPLVPSAAIGQQCLDDIIRETIAYLPQFATVAERRNLAG